MAVKSPTRSPQTPASATSRPLSPSSFPTTTTPSSHATLNQQIDLLLTSIESNTHRLALEAAYDPSIPFHPGCKDCVRDYVRHVRGAQPLKAAVEAAKEGERVKIEWEKKEKTVLREMREGRREEVGRWEERWRRGRGMPLVEGMEKGEGKKEGESHKKGKDEAIERSRSQSQSQSQSQANSSPAALAKAAKAMWGGRLARQGGEDVATPTSTMAATQGAQPDLRVGASFGQDVSPSNIDMHGQDSRHDIEQAQQAFHDLDLDQQLALLLNTGQDS